MIDSQIHWYAVTRFHDWRGIGRDFLFDLVSNLQNANIIGAVNHVKFGGIVNQTKYNSLTEILAEWIDTRDNKSKSLRLEVEGLQPYPWKMNLLLFPFDILSGQVLGYNAVSLWFDASLFEGENGSEYLVQLFQKIHHSSNTEFGFIHLQDDYNQLTDFSKGGQYSRPVTFGPMFTGVYWLTFIGKDHLKLFDSKNIKKEKIQSIKWSKDGGVIIRISEDIIEANTPNRHNEMFALTSFFKSNLEI